MVPVMIKDMRMIIPIRCKFEVNSSFIPTADNNAHPAGLSAFTILLIYLFVLNLLRTL